ncbi:hypothetical protein SDC9_135911 [bioreactor metagenome]|uniref:Uncharacterized protein n=1 Tax=bioreactor metagenome TaxID=1076179 RepID=A0A645DHS0_9ZZZZ
MAWITGRIGGRLEGRDTATGLGRGHGPGSEQVDGPELVDVRVDDVVGREQLGGPQVARGTTLAGEGRLDHAAALGGEHPGEDGQGALVERQRGGGVAGHPGIDDLPSEQTGEVGGGPDQAHATDRQQREGDRVVTGVVGQVGGGDDLRRLDDLTLGVLHRHDARVLGEREHRLGLHRDAGPARDVVDDHRQVGGVGRSPEMGQQPLLRGTGVVRGDDEQTVGAGTGRLPGQLAGVPGGIGADPGDDVRPVPDLVDDSRDQGRLLLVGGRRSLPGGAVDDQTVVAQIVHQMGGERPGGRQVQLTLLIERRHHGGQQPAEGRLRGSVRGVGHGAIL